MLLLGSLLLAPGGGIAAGGVSRAAITLGVALVCSIINWLYIEPLATGLMFQRWVCPQPCPSVAYRPVAHEPCDV